MNEVQTTKKISAITAVIFVAAALVTLPYQTQVANAALPAKKYQVYVTLAGVPANAGELEVNATINRNDYDAEIVSSPTNGDTVKFTIPGPVSSLGLIVCGTQVASPEFNDCALYPVPSKPSGPIRVDFAYPTTECC
jgi:hypothetical protein